MTNNTATTPEASTEATPQTSALVDFFENNHDGLPSDTNTSDIGRAILYLLTVYEVEEDLSKELLGGVAQIYPAVRTKALELSTQADVGPAES